VLYDNIANTIGVEFEFLPFDNSKAHKGICEAYNTQSKLARGEVVCFVHDDIKFITVDWGKRLNDLFGSNPEIGLVGVAGSGYKTKNPSLWTTAPENMVSANLIQHFKHSEAPASHLFLNPSHAHFAEAVTLDGVFLATRSDVLDKVKFDEETLKGFHGYDVDFSIQVGRYSQVVVTLEILLEHFSEGSLGPEWLEAGKKISKKWVKILPISKSPLSWLERGRMEYSAMFVGFRAIDKTKTLKWARKCLYFLYCFSPSFLIIPFVKKRIDRQMLKRSQS